MNFKSFMEALKGNQHKLDKNKNGKLDAHDFKLLRKEEDECEYDDEMDEDIDRVARSDYKATPSGRKSHKQIVFKNGESESDEDKAKSQREQFEIEERTMTDAEMKKREEIVKGMKKNVAGFKSKYGDRAKEVMYATANKMAMKEESEEMYDDLEEQAPVAPTLVKHRIGVTVSDPDHPMASKRTEKMQKFVVVTHSDNKEGAKAVGEKFYKKKGLRVHDSHHAGMVNEEVEELDELSTNKLLSYRSKATEKLGSDPAKDAKRKAGIGVSGQKVKDRLKANDDVNRVNMSRVKQLARQAMKTQMKEDYNLSITDEQADSLIEAANLHEISKATLGSYVKKAAFDSAMKGVRLGGSTKQDYSAEQDAMLKRQRGISRAVRRLVRKEGMAEGSISDKLVRKEEFHLDEAMISYSDFLGKLNMHRKAGNAIVDDKYTTNHATYTTVGSDGTARKTTHTPAGSKHRNVGKIKIDDDEDGDKPVAKPAAPARGRGRPSGSTGSVYKPRSAETKAAAAAKAAASKAANKK